jgi:agmatinase
MGTFIGLIYSVLDSHLDTWAGYPGQGSEQLQVNHGTFLAVAQREGLISNSSIHAGIRCKLAVGHLHAVANYPYDHGQGMVDIEHDMAVGFQLITTNDIDDLGIPEIIRRIRRRVGDNPVYLR